MSFTLILQHNVQPPILSSMPRNLDKINHLWAKKGILAQYTVSGLGFPSVQGHPEPHLVSGRRSIWQIGEDGIGGSHFCFGDRPNPFLLECAQIFQRQKSLKIILSLQPESSLLFIFYINKNQLGQERRNVFVFNLELKISKWNISQIHAMWGVLCQKYNSSWTFWKDISWLEFILTKWVGVLCNLS